MTRAGRVSVSGLLFGCTLFASSALLFLVQPMFAKMALPLLGGSPGVWNTCVVFFQAALLCGYAYAHGVARLPLQVQVTLHAGLVALAALTLPITIPATWQAPADDMPVLWLLGLLSAQVGAAFIAVSANAPLLQRWFSLSTAASQSDPYLLYATSNLGSLASLLAYPFLIEPAWALPVQSRLWTWGFGLVGALVTACGVLAWRARPGGSTDHGADAPVGAEPFRLSWSLRARWVALAAVPSSLMLSVTTYLSTDIAAVPLLWILPLMGYLLSFVWAFGPRTLGGRGLPARLVPILVCSLMLFLVQNAGLPLVLAVVLHLVCFGAVASALHIELSDRRPPARHLTEFYLWLSAGGVAGGAFTGIVSPIVFTGVAEYPIGLVLACLLLPRAHPSVRRPAAVVAPVAMGALVWAGASWSASTSLDSRLQVLLLAPVTVWAFSLSRQRPRFALALACCFAGGALAAGGQRVLLRERSFFGIYRVERDAGGLSHKLWHGTTLHGEQRLAPDARLEPMTYYHRAGPAGQAISAVVDGRANARVAAVGLGAGSLAAYARAGQRWTFYEIDPDVQAIAADARFFTYLTECAERCSVVLGDARISLARSSERFDFIVLDAFSSDAIPVHLVTREALDLYLSRLEEGGVMAFHVSNRHLALRPALGALFANRGLIGLAQLDLVPPPDSSGRSASEWLVAARRLGDLGTLPSDARWTPIAHETDRRIWTDQYSDILSVLVNPFRQ